MRCISQHGNYAVCIRPQRQVAVGDGAIQVTVEPIYARFDKDGLVYENEYKHALETFQFKGQFQHLDEATPVDPRYRLSVFDTSEQGYDDETRELVENRLREIAAQGSNEFFIVTDTPIAAPWPAYDASLLKPAELVAKCVIDGYDLSEVLAYERLFGQNRPEIVSLLEETIKETQEMTVSA